MPGVLRNACVNLPSAAESFARGSATANWSGPLKPGPKPLARSSNAWRVVWPAGSLPASLDARRSPSAGAANASMVAVATMAVSAGRRCTRCTHRSQKAGLVPSAPGAAWRLPSSPTRRPIRLRNAGSRVSDAASTTTTPIAAATAAPLSRLTPSANIPSRAITTVVPANRTARPEVLIAASTACSTSPPFVR